MDFVQLEATLSLSKGSRPWKQPRIGQQSAQRTLPGSRVAINQAWCCMLAPLAVLWPTVQVLAVALLTNSCLHQRLSRGQNEIFMALNAICE